MILSNDEAIAKKINSAVFPGIQGGPLMHVIAAKAVAFGEALQPEFTRLRPRWSSTTPAALAAALMKGGLDIVSGGTDNHLMLVDLRPKGVTGKRRRGARSERADITCNKNGIPFDPAAADRHLGRPPRHPGRHHPRLRRGRVRRDRPDHRRGRRRPGPNGPEGNDAVEAAVKARVKALCDRFPIYASL